MPNENKEVKATDIVEVEVKGKKYKVTKAFKDDMEADRADLATKATTLETTNLTLKQRLEAMEKDPPKVNKGGDVDDDGDDEVTFADLMDRPGSAISKTLQKELKKLGLDPTKLQGSDVDQKVQLILAQDKWWTSFYKEHDYFDPDVHGDLIQIQLKRLLPKLKDKSQKDARKEIADAVADMLGRKIIKGKLEHSTTSRHEAANGMQLEGADGSEVDNSENADDTNRNKGKSGSMAEDLRQRRATRQKAAKSK
jgi:hypothetical protein